ncbi:MAG: prepilin-type N-terminal cleavage/methylation domain-containing protein [Gemmatimonadetes bacterium]|nr:prepilin-type N-terminal cleavage/methylation domain-containing protein [Gemmatimonadota bacterium]MDA1103105.1 prepilin-type N-terminal cleavage/methylation domain-containing protein [Gemmatimonadota bacterium]
MERKGFTLIELLIVVVVIGILATIAIPKFSAMRTKSYIAAVTSDLKNVASQQEIYLSNQYSYSSTIAAMDMQLTAAVSVTINEATGTGWAATGTHTGLAGQQCGIYFGDAAASGATPATAPGTVQCN